MARWSMSFSSMHTAQIPHRCGSLSWLSAQMMGVMIRSERGWPQRLLTLRIRVLKRRLEYLRWLVVVGGGDLIGDLGSTLKRRNQRAICQVEDGQMNPLCCQGLVSRTSNEPAHSKADWLCTARGGKWRWGGRWRPKNPGTCVGGSCSTIPPCRGWDLLPGQITSCGPWQRPGIHPENRKLEDRGPGGLRQVVQDGKAASQLLAQCWKHLHPSLAWSHGGRQWSMINFWWCFWMLLESLSSFSITQRFMRVRRFAIWENDLTQILDKTSWTVIYLKPWTLALGLFSHSVSQEAIAFAALTLRKNEWHVGGKPYRRSSIFDEFILVISMRRPQSSKWNALVVESYNTLMRP